ncbi:MAG: phosphoribosylanthranilate isomerase [Gammaproteobacteria bacterium]|nr:phosphoribosylanthranilate isomerase [Gammaproteobacteria bacterium]
MNSRTRVKICGLTRIDDAMHAVGLGADAIGLVFHQPSPRSIDIESAIKIRKAMPPFVTITALLMNENEDWIERVIKQVQPDCLQFHGNEASASCNRWELPYIKAIPMGSVGDAKAYASSYPEAQGFLLDSNVAGRQGGSGDTFDWSQIPSSFGSPLLLAGGLNPGNVAEAIVQVKPWAVDVSSGIEASKGIKDKDLMNQFFSEVKRGDAHA